MSTLFDTHSTYTYRPQHSFYLDDRMIGDTLSVFIKVTFNTDLGESEEQEQVLNIIVDED